MMVGIIVTGFSLCILLLVAELLIMLLLPGRMETVVRILHDISALTMLISSIISLLYVFFNCILI